MFSLMLVPHSTRSRRKGTLIRGGEGGGLIEGGLTRNIGQTRKRGMDRAHDLT